MSEIHNCLLLIHVLFKLLVCAFLTIRQLFFLDLGVEGLITHKIPGQSFLQKTVFKSYSKYKLTKISWVFITKFLSPYKLLTPNFKTALPGFFACSCLLITRYTFLRLNYDSSIFLHLVINKNILLSFTINSEFIKSLITPSVLNEIFIFFCSVCCSYCGAQTIREYFSHLTVVRKLWEL